MVDLHCLDSNAGNTRRERDLDRDVVELGLLSTGVCELDAAHLHDGLALGCNAGQLAGLEEAERELVRRQLEVGLGLGVQADEVRQVALVDRQLELVNVDDVCTRDRACWSRATS
jgi:hypothetical protein